MGGLNKVQKLKNIRHYYVNHKQEPTMIQRTFNFFYHVLP